MAAANWLGMPTTGNYTNVIEGILFVDTQQPHKLTFTKEILLLQYFVAYAAAAGAPTIGSKGMTFTLDGENIVR